MERDQSKPPIEAGPLLNLALFAAAWCLWGPLLLFALLMMRRGGEGAYGFAVALFQIGAYACPAGALVVAVYAAVVRPWRQPAAKAWFFWIQVCGVAVISLAAGGFMLDDWRKRHEHAARQGLAEQAGEQERQMDVALLSDNYSEFENHYRACGSFCPQLPWLRKAVAARAPRILGLLLEGMSPGGSDLGDIGKAGNGSICRDGAATILTLPCPAWLGRVATRPSSIS